MNDKKSDVKTIFGRALEMENPKERAAYLDETCAGDVELRKQVGGLLAAVEKAGSFMSGPAIGPAVPWCIIRDLDPQ